MVETSCFTSRSLGGSRRPEHGSMLLKSPLLLCSSTPKASYTGKVLGLYHFPVLLVLDVFSVRVRTFLTKYGNPKYGKCHVLWLELY